MDPITVKGINNNLVLVFNEGSYEDFVAFMENRFQSNPKLFQGSPVVFKGPGLFSLSFQEMASLQKICLNYGMMLNNVQTGGATSTPRETIIRRNVRSGQRVHTDGLLTIWGDVNDGAEISAGSDIVVVGRLAGIVHAGCYGNAASRIFALQIATGQIRIGPLMASTLDKPQLPAGPAVAFSNQGGIEVVAYHPRMDFNHLFL